MTIESLLPREPSYLSAISPGSLWTGTSWNDAIACEHRLLERYVRSAFTLGRVPVDLPSLGLGTQHINVLDINSDAPGVPILWLHGAGAGLGFGYRNYDALASLGGVRRRVIGIDWLGQAGSSRPSYPYGGLHAPSWTKPEEERVSSAIAFSVDSLEALRDKLGLEQVDIVAHSMGGYLSTQYALAHPERVRRLVLVSPVGWAAKPKGELAKARAAGVFGALWDSHVGNFGLLRTVGRIVKGVAKGAVVGRFGIDDEEERALVSDYFWSQLCGQSISSERSVNWLLEPYVSPAPFGFYAKRPVSGEPAERLARLPPTTLLYGSHDLHYIPTMPEAVKAVAAATASPVTMSFVRGSDHHLYIDNPADFHAYVQHALA